MTAGGPPDPDKGVFLFISGRKGSGKSVVARTWADAYPYDRVIVDPTHDIARDFKADGIPFHQLRGGVELPARLPAPKHDSPQTWIFSPDMGSPTALDEMDRVVGLCLSRGPTMLWCDEFGTMTRGSKTYPNMRRVLHHGRHDRLTLLCCCPRPIDVDPLGINQADLVYSFAMANPDDRERVAKNIGWSAAEFDTVNDEVAQLNAQHPESPYWHSLFDHRVNELWIMPPLPRRRRGRPEIGTPGHLVEAAGDDQLAAAAGDARRERGTTGIPARGTDHRGAAVPRARRDLRLNMAAAPGAGVIGLLSRGCCAASRPSKERPRRKRGGYGARVTDDTPSPTPAARQ